MSVTHGSCLSAFWTCCWQLPSQKLNWGERWVIAENKPFWNIHSIYRLYSTFSYEQKFTIFSTITYIYHFKCSYLKRTKYQKTNIMHFTAQNPNNQQTQCQSTHGHSQKTREKEEDERILMNEKLLITSEWISCLGKNIIRRPPEKLGHLSIPCRYIAHLGQGRTAIIPLRRSKKQW